MSLTVIILLANVLVSLSALRNSELFFKIDFQPYMIVRNNQWYRFVTHAFVHADGFHLAVNMYVLYTFGRTVESSFQMLYGANLGIAYFILLYIGGVFFSAIPGYARNRENYNYHGVGASGAVSAIVFAYILINPMQKLGLIFIPGIGIPAFIFGGLYLVYEVYMDRNRNSRIAHSAHYYGAIFGFVFTAATKPELVLRLFE
ncbi:MAG: rhomboid family intramembrane serine protease [Salibacteraceae bacterium]